MLVLFVYSHLRYIDGMALYFLQHSQHPAPTAFSQLWPLLTEMEDTSADNQLEVHHSPVDFQEKNH
jgi:hypothetical protein